MDKMKNVSELVEKNNGLVSYEEFLSAGLTKYPIQLLTKQKPFEKVSKGLYYHKDYFQDTLSIYQKNNKKLIYSNETALYLLNLTDRFPR